MQAVHLLRDAKAKISEAQGAIAKLWELHQEARTPRVADIVSLIDRASAKLRLEIERTLKMDRSEA